METFPIQVANTERYRVGDDIILHGREFRVVEVVDENTLLVYLRA